MSVLKNDLAKASKKGSKLKITCELCLSLVVNMHDQACC